MRKSAMQFQNWIPVSKLGSNLAISNLRSAISKLHKFAICAEHIHSTAFHEGMLVRECLLWATFKAGIRLQGTIFRATVLSVPLYYQRLFREYSIPALRSDFNIVTMPTCDLLLRHFRKTMLYTISIRGCMLLSIIYSCLYR